MREGCCKNETSSSGDGWFEQTARRQSSSRCATQTHSPGLQLPTTTAQCKIVLKNRTIVCSLCRQLSNWVCLRFQKSAMSDADRRETYSIHKPVVLGLETRRVQSLAYSCPLWYLCRLLAIVRIPKVSLVASCSLVRSCLPSQRLRYHHPTAHQIGVNSL